MLMNLKKPFLLILVIICCIALILVGCVSKLARESNDDSGNGVVNEPTSSPHPVSSETPDTVGITTAFPQPTLTQLQLEKLYQRLFDETCDLPCYLGIVPGVTSFEEANAILTELGAMVSPAGPLEIQEDVNSYTYYFDIVIENELSVQQRITLVILQDKVLLLRTDVDQRQSHIFYEYWSRYTVQSMLEHLGRPELSYVYIGYYEIYPGYSIRFFYPEQGVYYNADGIKQDGLVCPQFKEDYTGLIQIEVLDPDYFEVLSLLGLIFEPSRGFDKPIPEALDISESEFYEGVLSNPTICFEPIFVTP